MRDYANAYDTLREPYEVLHKCSIKLVHTIFLESHMGNFTRTIFQHAEIKLFLRSKSKHDMITTNKPWSIRVSLRTYCWLTAEFLHRWRLSWWWLKSLPR